MTVVNLTPHPVILYTPDTPDMVEDPGAGVVTVWDMAGPMARCTETRRDAGTVTLTTRHGDPVEVPLAEVGFGEVTGLPDPRSGVVYIVSRAAAERATGRADVFYPDRPVRTKTGQIIGCRALARAATSEVSPDGYTYPHKDPRGILQGERWEDLIDGRLVAVLPPGIDDEFGAVAIRIGDEMAHLHREVAREFHEALGYARRRADGQQCPECPEFGEPTAPGSSNWRCLNGHIFDVETTLQRVKACDDCLGYGNQ